MTFTIQVTARFIKDYVTEFEKHIQLETFAMFPILLHVDFCALSKIHLPISRLRVLA